MRDNLPLVLPLGVDNDPHNEEEEKEADDNSPAEEVVVVIPCPQHADNKLRRVDVVAEFKLASLTEAGKNGMDSSLLHRKLKIDIRIDDRSCKFSLLKESYTKKWH